MECLANSIVWPYEDKSPDDDPEDQLGHGMYPCEAESCSS